MPSFTELLLEQNLLSERELARAEQVRARAGGRLPATLARLGLVAETALAQALADARGLSTIAMSDLPDGPVAIDGLNPAFLRRRSVLPLAIGEDDVALAMADPDDREASDAIAFAAGLPSAAPSVATFSDIAGALAAFGDLEEEKREAERTEQGWNDDLERILEGESEAPVIRLVQRMLADAVDRGASDVHVEPLSRALALRYRIDGRLIEIERHSDSLAAPVASRIKVMAGLDIAETRLPQDGRLRLTVRGTEVDVRVSTSPTAHGESVVLRLLGRAAVPIELDRLGLPAPALAALGRALDRPHGIVLVTGPTGSGKTTTLYAALNRLRRPDVKILTVEDPVEILLDGVNQVQVRPEIDLSYATALRAFLRQDPDILMIGEIRDRDTAEIALRAALTGHLVLSTLHANSALGAFTRLEDIGIEPFLTAATVVATAAQRLIRALCPDCASDRSVTAAEESLFGEAGLAAPDRLMEAAGCPRCSGTGFRGRLPLIEVVEVDEPLRAAIRAGRPEERETCRPAGETLLGHGLGLAAAGRTSVAEVQRAVQLG